MMSRIFRIFPLVVLSILCVCFSQAQSIEFIKQRVIGIEALKTIMNNNHELILAGAAGGNPSVMKMDTQGNVIWHKTFTEEPVRKNSDNPWRFRDLRADDEGNIYLYAEENALSRMPPPRVVKLDNNGNLIWASEELPIKTGFARNTCTWIHLADTVLTVAYKDNVTRLKMNSGVILGEDLLLGGVWINFCINDMVFNDKHYRQTLEGFFVFEESGEYSYEHKPEIPQFVRHVDSNGFYVLKHIFLDTNLYMGLNRQLQLYDFGGNLMKEEIVINELTFDHEDSLSTTKSYAGYLFHPQKGILLFGNYYRELNEDSIIQGKLFTQIAPANFEILFDTIIHGPPQWGDAHFAYEGDKIFLQGARATEGQSPYILRFDLKDVDEYPVSVTEKQQKTNAIKIYPNPSSTGEFIIQSQNESITKVDVFTMTGQIVHSQKVNALQETLQMDTKGIYLVRVTTDDNKTETLKIVNQ